MILDGGTLRAAGPRTSQKGSALLAVVVALVAGAILGMELVPPAWVLIGAFGLVFVAWVSVVVSFDTAILWLVGSVIFQNFLTLDLAFSISPVYVLSVVVFVRLMLEAQYGRLRAPMDGVARAWILIALISIPVAFYLSPRLPSGGIGLRYTSLRPIFQLLALLLSVLPYYVLVSPLALDRGLYERALRLFVSAGSAVSLLALYEQAAYYAGLPNLDVLAGLSSDLSGFGVAGTTLVRSRGTFLEPSQLGGFLILTSALTMSMLAARARPDRRGYGRRRLWVALVVQTCALAVTFSGGAYLGFLMACLVLVVLARFRLRAVLVLVTTGTSILLGALLLARLQSGGNPLELLAARPQATIAFEQAAARSSSTPAYEYSRTPYRRASLELARRYPVTGVGIGNFGYGAVMVDARLRPDAGSYGVLWGLIGEYGLPGAILFTYFAYAFVSSVLGSYRRFGAVELAGFAAGFAGFLTQSLGGGYSRLEPTAWVFVSLAMAAVLHSKRRREIGGSHAGTD